MNMIEKAVARATGRPFGVASGEGGDDPNSFDLDHDRLAERGLYHAGAEDARLGAELRVVRRRLLRRLGLSRRGRALHVRRRRNIVMVCAPHAGAGVTFTALNLALSFALEDGMDALVAEASASVGEWLGLAQGAGLGEWLAAPGEAAPISVDSYCLRARSAPLRVLRAGAPVVAWPALFADQAMGVRLAGAAPEGLVIIDAPPAHTPQAAALAEYADEILMVVCAEGTRSSSLVAAIDELVDINPEISLMLNRRPGGDAMSDPGFYEHNRTNSGGGGSVAQTRQGGAFQ